MNRLRVIGSGNAFNLDGRAHACFLLEECLLLDCGASSPLRMRSLGVDFSKIKGVLITHFHGDHAAGLPFLYLNLHFMEKRTEPLTVLGPPGIREISERLLDVTYPGMNLSFPLLFREIGGPASFEFFEIEPFAVTHKEESLGYRISWNHRTMAFSGDTAYDEKLFALVEGTDLALVELSMFENDGTVPHVALSQLKGELRPKRLVFTHLYDELARAAETRGFQTAVDGQSIEF